MRVLYFCLGQMNVSIWWVTEESHNLEGIIQLRKS
jgi:hypothetical protein